MNQYSLSTRHLLAALLKLVRNRDLIPLLYDIVLQQPLNSQYSRTGIHGRTHLDQ